MGEVNTSSYPTAASANNPLTTAATAVGIGNSLQQNRLMQVQEQSNRLAIANSHFSNIAAYFGSLAAKVDESGKPIVTKKDFINQGLQGINNGLFTPAEYTTVMNNLPKDGDSAALQAYAHSFQLKAMDALTQTNQTYGTNASVAGFDPISKTPRQYYGRVAPTSQGGGISFAPGQGPSDGAPGVPMAPNDTNTPTNPSPGETANNLGTNITQKPNGIQTGPALGQAGAAEVTAIDSAKQGQELQRQASNMPAQKALLGEMDAKLDKFNSGPGSNDVRAMTAAFNRISPIKIDPEGVAGNEVFNKLSTTLAQQQFQALGGTGTDDKLASAVSTNPNNFMSNMGNKEVIALLKGNADAISVANKEWQQWKKQNGSDSYGEFITNFNQNYDPRIFQAQYLNSGGKKDLLKGMTPVEKEQFKQQYEEAHQKGWFK